MTWYDDIGCQPPSFKDETLTIIVDAIMMSLSSICLIVTIYGTYRYIIDHKKLQKTNLIKPAKPLYIGGLVFFIISSLTLANAFICDALYLICPRLDDIEGPIYHAIYFIQIFCLWIILFLRIHYIFKNSTFDLSKFVVRFYLTIFCLSLGSIIPIYVLFQADADAFITLPYVILSGLFSTAILFTFIHKLIQIFSKLGPDELLLKTMVKNTILAASSISCTFLVVITLIILYVKHDGFHQRRSVLEELLLELFILIDIVSNFVCVLFSYAFFDRKFQLVCGKCNDKIVEFTSKRISSSIDHKSKTRSRERTIDATFTTTQPHSHFTKTITQTIEASGYEKSIDVMSKDDNQIEKQLHEQSKTKSKPVASLILKLSNKLSKKKSNSRSNSHSSHNKTAVRNQDILLTLIDAELDKDKIDESIMYKPSLKHVKSVSSVIEINHENMNKIHLRPTRSQPVPNVSGYK